MDTDKLESIHFNNLSVTSIETNSGIFIGNNSAPGWHSASKSNRGFGSSNGSVFYQTVNIVIDNDGIDTVINDVNQTEGSGYSNESNVPKTIKLNAINLGIASVATAVAVGENNQGNWRSHYKENRGFGTAAGMNQFTMSNNNVCDNDAIDNVINDVSQASSIQKG